MKIQKKVSIILISYKSKNKLKKFISNVPRNIRILIVDNSKDFSLKKVFKKFKNIKVYISKENKGYGASINFAVKKIKTKYFIAANPDITGINKKSIGCFTKYANILKDNFSVIGPHFKNASNKGHYQTNLKYKIRKIHNVHGSLMFFNKEIFLKNKGFDKNFFMYWEETDYTKRANSNGYNAYQLNLVKVKHDKGKSVESNSLIAKKNIEIFYSWHFIWSKYYFYYKHYGRVLSVLYFIPIICRLFIRVNLNKNNKNHLKYTYRWDGLINSILLNKSSLRLSHLTYK